MHTPNFTPVLSYGLFRRMYLKGRQAVFVPLALMVISDFIIGFYPLMFLNMGQYSIDQCFGPLAQRKKSFVTVLGGSIVSAVFFLL